MYTDKSEDKHRSSSTKSSSMLSKKFSVTIKNLDFNAYRAYKLVNDDSNKGKPFNPHEILRGEHNPMKFPFGLKEERFRWQTSKNLGEKWELSGNMVRRYSQGRVETTPDWGSFLQKTPLIQEKPNTCSSTRASSYKYAQDKNSKRTVQPNAPDVSFTPKKTSQNNKSLAQGSISNLIQKTPEAEAKFKMHSEKMIQCNEIFTPSDPINKHVARLPVDIESMRKSGDYAGVKYRGNDAEQEDKINNR
jgi:hypothetical protein